MSMLHRLINHSQGHHTLRCTTFKVYDHPSLVHYVKLHQSLLNIVPTLLVHIHTRVNKFIIIIVIIIIIIIIIIISQNDTHRI